MKHRWMDVVKRNNAGSSPKEPLGSPGSPHSHRRHASAPPSALASGLLGAGSMLAENPAFFHAEERCYSVTPCSVTRVLENCALQGGVHHTHLNILTYLGGPLRSESCCYPMTVQWFRAFGEHDDFQVIPDACDEWFTATADDIGARILAQVMIEDEDVVKAKMLEYGPIKEDPEVRSKVEMYLERKSVLFMGLQSLAVQDGVEYPNGVELRESWTLLIDDRRVRLTCESSLIPPFEGLYTSDIKVEILRSTSNEFCLFLAQNCFVRLRAESNIVRDIIVLTLRAFCKVAIMNDGIQDAISRGSSPMMVIRKLVDDANKPDAEPIAMPSYDLPWNRQDHSSADASDASDLDAVDDGALFHAGGPGSISGGYEFEDALISDAEALIGNAAKMGIKNQILPRAPRRITLADIPDLMIVDANEEAVRLRALSLDSEISNCSSSVQDKSDEHHQEQLLDKDTATVAAPPHRLSIDDDEGGDSIDDAIKKFMEQDSAQSDLDTIRQQYVGIFCALQTELRRSKQRVSRLSQKLDEKREENASFRNDIETLQNALTSSQIADKVHELVSDDLRQLLRRQSSDGDGSSGASTKPPPENFY